jgi:pimeloyl-ACP methyl ester carboxylesterase
MTDSSPEADLWFETSGQPPLRYRDAGRGPPVLLVHGWPLDLTMYDALAATLVDAFRVVRWDRRGFGGSAGVPSLSEDAADALRLLDRLGIGRTALLGTSQGCRVALAVAEAAPRRIDALVLDGAPALDGLPGRDWQNETPVSEYRDRLVERGIEALRADLVRHPLLKLHSSDPAQHRRMAEMLQRYRGADLLALPSTPPRAATPADPGAFARLRMPVLVLNGEHDTEQRRSVGAALEATIPRAVRRVVPRSGHLACWDNPAVYGGLVHEFLTHALSGTHRRSPGAEP